jgi:hypothetical protein
MISNPLTTPVAAQEASINKMWSAYTKEAGEYDKLMTDVWRKDTSCVLFFVSSSTDPAWSS